MKKSFYVFHEGKQVKFSLYRIQYCSAGTIQDNLDPDGQKPDKSLWEVLEQAHLKDFVSELSEKLDYDVGEGGDTLRLVVTFFVNSMNATSIFNIKLLYVI